MFLSVANIILYTVTGVAILAAIYFLIQYMRRLENRYPWLGESNSSLISRFEGIERENYLLTADEQRFFTNLQLVLANDFLICPKVRIIDLIKIPPFTRKSSFMGKLAQEPVDFVICDRRACGIIGAIELRSSENATGDRLQMKNFVEKLLNKTGIPFIRISLDKNFDPQSLADVIVEGLFSSRKDAVRPESPSAAQQKGKISSEH